MPVTQIDVLLIVDKLIFLIVDALFLIFLIVDVVVQLSGGFGFFVNMFPVFLIVDALFPICN